MNSTKTSTTRTYDLAANPDPITKAPGAHPVGTGIGAAAGGAAGVGSAIAAGAVMGSMGGPVGTAVGAAAGAVAGGLIGKGIAEQINPSVEHEYWQKNYATRPYATPGASYDQYGPAYQLGWESRAQHSGKSFDQVEGTLGSEWDKTKGKSKLNWDQARPAAQDAWDRIDSENDE